MTENEKLAYLAGLFDGEGCLAAHMGYGDHLGLRLQLGMTDEETVRFFADAFNLPVYRVERATAAHPNYKANFTAVACGRRVGEILQQLQPFLRTKAKRARISILFANEVGDPSGGRKVSKESKERRLVLAAALGALNK